MSLSACRVVLVRPHYPGNIGAVARVMGNMGLDDLCLVAPVANPLDTEAKRLSTHAESILHRARVVDALSDALADRHLAIATSAQHGGLFRKQSVGTPEDLLPRIAERLAASDRAALVFGPEPSGLTDAEVTRCHFLLTIPTGSEHPSLNLAQAVAICLYVLRRSWTALTPTVTPETALIADLAEQEHLFTHLQQALAAIHFLYGEKADALMHALRHLLGRARLTAMETKLLHGLARQILWHAEHGSHTMAEPPEPPPSP